MPLPNDPDPKLAEYVHPERLVTTGWLAEHLDDPNLVVVESDEDILLYETGHIPGAVKVDWHTELNDQLTRDYLDAERFAQLMRDKGIGRDSTVVFYGDKSNWVRMPIEREVEETAVTTAELHIRPRGRSRSDGCG